jgi:hypothetical protein
MKEEQKMRLRLPAIGALIALAFGLVVAVSSGPVAADIDDIEEGATFRVTIENLTDGQPFSPPVVATHRSGIRMFRVGRSASSELEAIAEDGNQMPMVDLFRKSHKVTHTVDVGAPVFIGGMVTVDIIGRPGDKFSMATMLICTNDGITGIDRARLPSEGSVVYWLNAYDAGTEDNTEMSQDIVDPCSAIGPTPLPGDPNGNEDAAVDTDPHQAIMMHPGIQGGQDLTVGDHGWTNPVAKVTITRVEDDE